MVQAGSRHQVFMETAYCLHTHTHTHVIKAVKSLVSVTSYNRLTSQTTLVLPPKLSTTVSNGDKFIKKNYQRFRSQPLMKKTLDCQPSQAPARWLSPQRRRLGDPLLRDICRELGRWIASIQFEGEFNPQTQRWIGLGPKQISRGR